MTSLVPRRSGGVVVRGPGGLRSLGIRQKPSLRLAIGYRDEQKKGAPVKVDYLIAKPGPQGRDLAAARKFHETYGEQPKAADVLLPAELHQALRIEYRAFAGANAEEGGVMVARGQTNFALEEFCGGPDVLTVWRQDGTVDEVEVTGLDDPTAAALSVDLYTTFRFGLPGVLGFGSFAEISTKGKESTDNLWSKLRLFYGAFSTLASVAVRPKLVVRPSTARPVVKDRETGEPRRIKTRIFVLDLVAPDEREIESRVRERAELLRGLTLYQQLPSGPAQPWEDDDDDEPESLGAGEVVDPGPEGGAPGEALPEPESAGGESTSSSPAPGSGSAAVAAPEPSPEDVALAAAFAKRKPPLGSYQRMTLGQVLKAGPDGLEGLEWMMRREWAREDAAFARGLSAFVRVHAPELHGRLAAEGLGEARVTA